jgi:hypothetical protein
MSNSEEKIWVHRHVAASRLEEELNNLAREGYQVFQLIPMIASYVDEKSDQADAAFSPDEEEEEGDPFGDVDIAMRLLTNVHIVAFHLMRFAEAQQAAQKEATMQQLKTLAKGTDT